MGEKTDIWQGTLALMVLRTLEALGPLLTKAGQRQVKKAAAEWEETTAIIARFLVPAEEG